ncbi:MAG: acylphosphatase [Gammaproteobacteria bacterium]|nr:acylphosphatase [Gammaproteobacteria bacterium]MDH3412679.1 acylphosphatase [Gammaproteobacteria bacterium]
MTCRRCLVSGRVQGVFFRGSTQREALALGLKGRAANLADGRVEVIACGPKDKLDLLCKWLEHGPPSASVTSVACESWGGECDFRGFETI